MTINTKLKYLPIAALAVAVSLAGCSSSSSDDDPVDVSMPNGNGGPMTPPTTPPVVEQTELEKIQAAAMAAMTAAGLASDAAGMAASDAQTARANRATHQTRDLHEGNSGEMADAAQTHADAAAKAAMEAADAYELAKAATDVTAATRALIMAENAQTTAEKQQMYAETARDNAVMVADGELKIDGTMKSLGETTIDAMAGASEVTTGTGATAQTVITGLIKSMNPMATGDEITASPYVPAIVDDLSTEEVETSVKAIPYRQAAAERTFAIGKTLDSSDDMARLMLVTDYAGMNMVKVYAAGTAAVSGTKAGYLTITDGDAGDNNVALRSEGMFYPAGDDDTLVNTDSVAANAKPVEVFSYVDPTDSTRKYATLMTTSTTGTTTTYTYNSGADIEADAAAADGPDDGTILDAAEVTVGIPGPVAYKHIHFGVWAGLGEAAKDGSQEITGLGIGFVQSIGDGMTGSDMPNTGKATYKGDWVAAVQGATGDLSLTNGAASVSADFGKAEITASLTDLAKLEGSIDGSMFSGTKATVSANAHGLSSGGKFDGSFHGGFYGAKAAETAGIFDFSSTNGGAFRGAFGGNKQP